MKILVTGGLGFMGYHLVELLIESNPADEIHIVDDLSSTKTDFKRFKDKAKINIQDLRDYSPKLEFDRIYHLASPVGSLGILFRNKSIALDILELADKAVRTPLSKNGRMLYVSSSEIYGQNGARTETDDQVVRFQQGPRMEYALGKLSAEHMLLNHCNKSGTDLRIIRPFNAIGMYQSADLGFVIPRFFSAALRGEPITVYGDGTQRRAFCHATDIVSGIHTVMENGSSGEIYNVGNDGNIISISQLALKIKEICKSKSEIINVNPQDLHGKEYLEAFEKIPNLSKISSLGWKAKIDLEKALQLFYDSITPKGTLKMNYA
jgi:nucleoside-diphosphate-sugar epimerase